MIFATSSGCRHLGGVQRLGSQGNPQKYQAAIRGQIDDCENLETRLKRLDGFGCQ